MVGICKVEIKESAQTLKALMREEANLEARERLHSLYLLKSGQADSVTHAAQLICRDRTTVQRWLKKYSEGGLLKLLAQPTGQGCKSKVPEAIALELQAQLATETGFSGYKEVQDWLAQRGVELTYAGTHYYVHYYLGASLKVPRPVSTKQDPVRVDLFKKL
jgi:transposase